jgi:O-antigen/teichoic acid export membrane protein
LTWWRRLVGMFLIESPALLVLGRTISAALSLATAPIVARAIGPDGRGETAAAIALFVIVPVLLAMGLPLEVRRLAATSDGHAILRTARRLVGFSTFFAIPLAALSWFTIFATFELDARFAAAAGLLLSPLAASWALDVGMLVAHRRYRAVFAMQVIQPMIYLVLVSGAWVLGIASVSSVLTSNVIGSVATFALGLALVRVRWSGETYSMVLTARNGLKYFGSAIAEAASSKLDQVIALPLIGAFQAGIYSVAATVAAVPLAIGQALGASYFTSIARAAGDDRRAVQGQAARAGIAAGLLVYPVGVAASVAFIPIIFGNAFVDAVPVAVVSLIGSSAMIASFIVSMALAADSKGIRMSVAQVVSLALGVVGLLVLGPWIGAIGAAAASTISYVALLVVLLVALRLPIRGLIPRWRDFVGVIRRLARD